MHNGESRHFRCELVTIYFKLSAILKKKIKLFFSFQWPCILTIYNKYVITNIEVCKLEKQ